MLQDTKMCFSYDVLPDGFTVKKGDMIGYVPYAMGRMKYIWGDDALEFKPERWLDNNGCFHQASPFKFTAFQVSMISIHVQNAARYNLAYITCLCYVSFFCYGYNRPSDT